MRTTVTLDADTEHIIRRRMQSRRVSFKQALNDAIREAESVRGQSQPFRTRTASMGEPLVDLDRALQLAGELDDEEILHKTRRGA